MANSKASRIAALVMLKLATPPYLLSYHGTDARNLASIMQQGLKAQHPGGGQRFDKGVYLTADMEKAARYAVEGTWSESSLPCILEVHLSGAKRVRKIYRDPLDRDEGNLYDNDNDYGADDDMEYLARAIAKVTGLRSWALTKETGIKLETYGDPAALSGMNLYRPLLAWARKNNLNIQQFKQTLFAELTPGDEFGDYTLTNDGTLTLNEDAYKGMHQKIYPKDIPPQAIKAVWLANVPANVQGERMTIQSKLLPQEVRKIVDTFSSIGSSNINQYELREFRQLVERLREKDEHNVYAQEIDQIEAVIQQVQAAYDEDDSPDRFDGPYHEALDEARNEVADMLENIAQYAHEMLYNPPGGKTTEFTKMTPQMALQLAQKENAHV